jgi:uncharacterized membrane protein YkoI
MSEEEINSNSEQEEINSDSTPAPKQKVNPTIVILVAIIIALVAVGGVLAYKYAYATVDNTNQESMGDGLVTDPNVFLTEEDAEAYQNKMIPSLNVNMLREVVCERNEEGQLVADVNIKNDNENQYRVQFIDSYSGDVIYTSGLIPAGSTLPQITLAKDLKPGTYDISVIFSYVSEEDNKTDLGSTGISIDFIVN